MDDNKDTSEASASSPAFRVWLCGAFRVERRVGSTYEVLHTAEWGGSSYPRLLLKALLCCPGRQARREALIDMLWPEVELEQAAQNLNTATTKLRRVLQPMKGQQSLLLTEDDYKLYFLEGQHRLWVDVDAAFALLKEAERSERTTSEISSFLEEAMTILGAGPFLGDDDGLWLTERRGEVDVARYNGRLRLAEAYEQQNMVVQAELQLRKLLADDPTDEDVVCRLMELLHRRGMKHKALLYYKAFTEVAEKEGSEPTEELRLLAERLRSEKHRSVLNLKRRSIDWGVAPSPDQFYGRSRELTLLKSWVGVDHCRMVAICGMGGIGKTSLAVVLANQMKDLFEYVFWRSLQHAPPLHHILQEGIKFLSDQQRTELPDDIYDQISLLIEYLRTHRCLLVLDNVETVLQDRSSTGSYREGYEGYGTFFQLIGAAGHRSCLLLTSREKPKELSRLEGSHAPIRSLQLSGVSLVEGQTILKDKDLLGSDEAWKKLIQLYAGNPLALKLVAEPIRELFHANISAFLKQEHSVVGDIHDLLDQQFNRLPERERDILYWLAIEREAASLETLWEDTVAFTSKKELFDSLSSLRRKSMIESSDPTCFTLQPVIMEYITDEFIREIVKELHTETLSLFASHALMKAQSKEYVRASQIRLILAPIAKQLLANMEREKIEKMSKAILAHLREASHQQANYSAGNLLNLLIQMRYDLRNYNFSHLSVRQAFLQGIPLPDVDFSHADLTTSVFTDTFGSILSVAFSPSGNLLAAGTTNNDIRLWHISHGTPYQTCQGHKAWVRSVAFSPDGRLLASGSDDRTIRLWEVEGGRCLAVLQGHKAWVRSVAFNPDGRLLASGGEDQTIRLWEVSTGNCLKILQGQMGRIRSVAFNPDGRLLASGGEDQTIRLWEVSTGNCLTILQGHKERIRSIAFSPDGKLLASGSDDQTVHLWEVNSGNRLTVLQGHLDCVRFVTFSPDGRLLASGSEDQTIRLWEVNSGICLKALQGHTNWVWSVVFSPSGSILASGSEDQTMRLWEVNSGNCLKTLQGYVNWAWSVAFSPDGKMLASGDEDQSIRLWDINNGSCLKTLQGHTSRVRSLTVSQNGRVLVSSSEDRTIRVWDMSDGSCLNSFQGYPYRVWSVALSPDGSTLVSGGEDQVVCLWDVQSASRLKSFQGHTDRIRAVAFHSDGKVIASSSEDQTVRLWDTVTGNCLNILQGHIGRVWTVAFSPDGTVIASGGEDQTIRLWDVAHGNNLTILQGHTDRIRSVAFSPDGKTLASGSEDQTVRLWEVNTGICLAILQGHAGRIRSVSFHPSNQILASSSDDGAIKFWDTRTNTDVKTLRIHKPYEGMNIAAVRGLTADQRKALKALGAVEANV
jgi:WD40 repeat protein/DNA-binding SARP family transcriptional activator